MREFAGRSIRRFGPIAIGAFICLALPGCGMTRKVMSVLDRPLNVSAPVQTSPGNFTVTADDASASVANAAALQAASVACATVGLRSRTVDTSSSVVDGRHSFTLNFQCQ